MKTTNKEMTIEEARKMLNAIGAEYPATEHNKKMMKKAVDEFLLSLRAARK
jgi:cysteine synthase